MFTACDIGLTATIVEMSVICCICWLPVRKHKCDCTVTLKLIPAQLLAEASPVFLILSYVVLTTSVYSDGASRVVLFICVFLASFKNG